MTSRFTELETESYYDAEDAVYRAIWDEDGSVHWGFFDESTGSDFLAAGEKLNRIMVEKGAINQKSNVLDLGCGKRDGRHLAGWGNRQQGDRHRPQRCPHCQCAGETHPSTPGPTRASGVREIICHRLALSGWHVQPCLESGSDIPRTRQAHSAEGGLPGLVQGRHPGIRRPAQAQERHYPRSPDLRI